MQNFERMKPIMYTNALCPHCGKRLLPSDVESYPFVCLDCDENFYWLEVLRCETDYFEVTFKVDGLVYTKNRLSFKELASRVGAEFLGCDDDNGYVDFGFRHMTSAEEMDELCSGVERILFE